ncbi:MAG: ribonuclease P protein component [Bacteroidales bacterium]|nr:ribonuclease P protein component [Bacteroidales bacterium]
MAGIHPFRKQTFCKQERLCNRSLINSLFTRGQHFTIYPVRVYWRRALTDQPFPAQVVIQVQRRQIRLAVKRNLVKRRMREAFRKNKGILYDYLEKKDGRILFAMVYYGHSILPSRELEAIIILILQRLTRDYEKSAG